MQPLDRYELIVVGGGMGGLAAASLAQRLGLRTALLEAHTKLGGCAGFFGRGPFTFDAGATALVGLGPGQPLGEFLRVVGVDFAAVPTSSYRVHLPDRSLDIVADPTAFERAATATFPGRENAQRDFWRLQAWVGSTLFRAAGGVPRLPWRSVGDAAHDLRLLGLAGVLAGTTWLVTVRDVLRLFGLDGDRAFVALIAMLLQDTAQAGPETVPFANAAACLQAYRLGMCRPRGGMKALVEGIGERFAALGGDLRTATLVDRVEADPDRPGEFVVVTRRRARLAARQVALNLPLDLASRLLGQSLDGRLARKSRAAWSAFTGYVAFDRDAVSDDGPLFHQVLRSYDGPIHDGNNVLVSLSPPGDEGYGPPDFRVATLSTHTAPGDWAGLDRASYTARKSTWADRLLDALGRVLPDARARLVNAEFASPRSFARYTRRTGGAVGGAPVSRRNSTFLSVGPDVLGPGLWVVGDSVFPGQGTMATVLSAVRVVERITGRSWAEIRADATDGTATPRALAPA
jgi:phytoene dehydrogenase-like protein